VRLDHLLSMEIMKQLRLFRKYTYSSFVQF
jgi:hypothetical protein